MDQDHTISKYDRLYAGLHDVSLLSKSSTIQNLEGITGQTETFTIQTARHAELGDYIFIQYVDDNERAVRIALPPRAANLIASQRDGLTARRRRIAGKAQAQARKERGELPGFLKGKKGK